MLARWAAMDEPDTVRGILYVLGAIAFGLLLTWPVVVAVVHTYS